MPGIKLVISLVWTILIIIGSSISGNTLDEIPIINIPYFDKFIHFTWYFFLYIFWYSYIINKDIKNQKIAVRIILIISIIFFGLIIEILQDKVFIKRSTDMFDFIADAAGAFFAFLIFFKLYQSKVFGRYL